MERHLVPHLLHPVCTLWSYSGEDNTDKLIFIRIIAFTFTLYVFVSHAADNFSKVAKYSCKPTECRRQRERPNVRMVERIDDRKRMGWQRKREKVNEKKKADNLKSFESYEWISNELAQNCVRYKREYWKVTAARCTLLFLFIFNAIRIVSLEIYEYMYANFNQVHNGNKQFYFCLNTCIYMSSMHKASRRLTRYGIWNVFNQIFTDICTTLFLTHKR